MTTLRNWLTKIWVDPQLELLSIKDNYIKSHNFFNKIRHLKQQFYLQLSLYQPAILLSTNYNSI